MRRAEAGTWAVLLVAGTIATPSAAVGQDADPPRHLVGLWAAERTFGPDVSGAVTLRREGADFWAEIGGHHVDVRLEGHQIRFEAGGERGYFRGRLSDDGGSIEGHWVQPWNFRSFSELATPLTLLAQEAGVWTGNLTPARDGLRFYLKIQRQPDGRLGAFIRNPEANIGRFYPIHDILGQDDALSFVDSEGRTRLQGIYHERRGRLSVYFPLNGGTYDFTRVDGDRASPFSARPVGAEPYRYRRPVEAEGWQSADPAAVGMSEGPLQELVRRIASTPIDAIDAPYIHGFLVARRGRLVLEEYFHGYSRHDPHATRSASKSVTSTLVGSSEHAGLLSRDALVYDAMGATGGSEDRDPRAARMTLEHLITNTSGLACDDSDRDSPGNEDVMQNQEDVPDWHRYTLDLPLVHDPGTHAAYCSGGLNLAGGVLARLANSWLPEVFREQLAEPLGIGVYHMNLTPTGEGYGGGGLFIKPRDFLKLGQLYLNDGVWNGRRLLAPGWAAEATTPRSTIRDEGYGYGWWMFSYPYEGREVGAFYAGGNGGQYVIVVPELELAVAIFGANYNQRAAAAVSKYEYVRDYVLAAIEDD